MRYINELPARIVIALTAGFLLAGASTQITRSCIASQIPADESAAQCAAVEKAVMHPSDLLSNTQNSLSKFSATFAVTALVAFALLSALNTVQKHKA